MSSVTTLCYIEKDGRYLMLLRNKKKADPNKNKWIGIGGRIEEGETPKECVKREAYEETGFVLSDPKYRGIVYFSDGQNEETMHLYTCSNFTGTLKECDEGELKWVDKKDIYGLNLWEGDKIFLELLETESSFFEVWLKYDKDVLVDSEVKIH